MPLPDADAYAMILLRERVLLRLPATSRVIRRLPY